MNDTGNRPPGVKLGFESELVTVPIDQLVPLKPLRPQIKESKKYAQIRASIRTIGIVEPPAVMRDVARPGWFFVLDGHLRIEALRDLGEEMVECLIATDDDTYSYNKRVNRLTATQEHRMICRAADRGVPEERLAEALGLDVNSIRRRFRMLNGVCDAASEMLRDTPTPMAVFEILKRMAPARQVEAAQLLIDQGNYSVKFAKALLFATPDRELVDPRQKKSTGPRLQTAERMARLERELASLQTQARSYEEAYAINNLHLTLAKTYLGKLLKRPRIMRWLSQNQPDYLEQFQLIAEIEGLTAEVTDAGSAKDISRRDEARTSSPLEDGGVTDPI